MRKGKVAVLASGGIDSDILIAELLKRSNVVHPIYVRCGLAWETAELFWLKKYLRTLKGGRLKPLKILDLPVGDLDRGGWAVSGHGAPGYRSRDESVYLPGRNLLLLSKVATYCVLHGIDRLAIGSLSGNPFPDATPRFFRQFSRVASGALGQRITVEAPFLKRSKKEILRRGGRLPLHLSFTCLSPRGLKPCGRCNKCAEKEKALESMVIPLWICRRDRRLRRGPPLTRCRDSRRVRP